MYPKPKYQYDLLLIGFLAVVAVVGFGGYELYQNFQKPPQSSPIPVRYTQSLTPTLDTATLEKLQARISISPEQYSTPAPTPTPTSKVKSSPLVSPSATPSTNSAVPKT